MARPRKSRRNWARSILAGMVAWPIPLAWPRRATTQSADLDAALVLVLANHIGDLDVLNEAIALAKRRMLDASQQQQQQQ